MNTLIAFGLKSPSIIIYSSGSEYKGFRVTFNVYWPVKPSYFIVRQFISYGIYFLFSIFTDLYGISNYLAKWTLKSKRVKFNGIVTYIFLTTSLI